MLCEIVTAGFGGQGILFQGDLLAQAALKEGKHVTYLPTYGVAMRGGTANCVVAISDEEVGSPLLDQPHVGIIMNEPSLVKFEVMVHDGGLIIANSSIIDQSVYNRDGEVRIVWVPATALAREIAGSERSANMVAVGAFLQVEPIVTIETIESVLREFANTDAKRALIGKNLAAMRAGMECAKR